MDRTDEDWKRLFDQVTEQIKLEKKQSTNSEVQQIFPIAPYIDHTLLALDATPGQIDKICDEAKEFSFAAVCIRPNYVSRAAGRLRGTSTNVATVIGFHEGTYPTASKVSEALAAVKDGARELDVVLNRRVFLAGSYAAVFAELHAIREACPKSKLKLILETSELSTDQVINACVLAYEAQWEYVKTSTGFCGRGASLEDVALMSSVATAMQDKAKGEGRSQMKVKASGGVRTWKDAIAMVKEGASRIGTSKGVSIAQEELQHSSKE